MQTEHDDSWIDSVDDAPDAVNGALGWRRRLPRWPERWRDRWGQRANELEDEGNHWIEAERLAWNEVIKEKAAAEANPTLPLAGRGRTQAQARFKETA